MRLRWLLCLMLPTVAFAEPRDDARRAFLAGLESAEQGDYRTAVTYFLEAEELYSHPATMFNIARAYEDLGEPERALRWYRNFSEAAPERAPEAAGAIARLEAEIAAAQAPPPVSPEPTGGAAATTEELERLRTLAKELEALAVTLAERDGPVAPPQDPGSDTPTPAAEDPTPAPPTGEPGGFLTEAYERVVVTASRYGQDPLDSPSTISVITADDIRLSGATNIPDVLRRVAGVEVMSLAIGTPSLGIRGFNSELSNKVLWLVDGRSVYWDFLAAPLPLNLPVAMEEIERIEVIRGPGAAVYGANAVTGVINIITREPGEGSNAILSFSGGSPDYLHGTALASGRLADVAYRFSAGYDQEGRWAQEPRVVDDGPQVAFSEDPDLGARKLRAHGRLDYRFLDRGFASLSGGYTQGEAEFYNIGALGNFGLRGRSHYLRTDLAYGPGHLRVFWNQEAASTAPWLDAVGSSRDLTADVRSDVVDVEAEGNFTFETGEVSHQLNVGAGYRYKRIQFDYLSGGFDNPWVEHHANAFVQEQLSWKWLGAVLSFRLDRHPLLPISKTLSPRGALLFRVANRTSLRVSGGTAYRAMNTVESYMDFNLGTSADGFFIRDVGGRIDSDGNVLGPRDEGLDPERIVTVELGAHDESSNFHVADVALYWNRVTDLIGLQDVTPSLSPYDPDSRGFLAGTTGWVNLSDLRYDAFGGEIDLRFFPVNGLDLIANASIQRILERAEGQDPVPDGSSSLVKFNAGALYRAPFRMDFTLMGHFYSAQQWRLREFDEVGRLTVLTEGIPARFLLSARIAGRPFATQDLELSLNVWNPLGFGEGFQEHPKGQPVGGRIFGNVTYEF